MQQKRLIILLADISGYTKFMLENQQSAVHGQMAMNMLIDAIAKQVDIPLVLQEIEGDAVFLYAADPGEERAWQRVVMEVSAKLGKFFEAFIAQLGVVIESTPCQCAVCSNIDKLGLKIIVHLGEAVFHEVAGRAQVSGSDVILAHRLLKNTLNSHEYLLLTAPAYQAMRQHLPGEFSEHSEHYEGFGEVPLYVRYLEQDFLNARDAIYRLDDAGLQAAVDGYIDVTTKTVVKATVDQLRRPVRKFTLFQKLLMLLEPIIEPTVLRLRYRKLIPKQQRARGQRRVR